MRQQHSTHIAHLGAGSSARKQTHAKRLARTLLARIRPKSDHTSDFPFCLSIYFAIRSLSSPTYFPLAFSSPFPRLTVRGVLLDFVPFRGRPRGVPVSVVRGMHSATFGKHDGNINLQRQKKKKNRDKTLGKFSGQHDANPQIGWADMCLVSRVYIQKNSREKANSGEKKKKKRLHAHAPHHQSEQPIYLSPCLIPHSRPKPRIIMLYIDIPKNKNPTLCAPVPSFPSPSF